MLLEQAVKQGRERVGLPSDQPQASSRVFN